MNNQEYKRLEKWIRLVDERLDNHLVGVAKEITEIKIDMSWIKKFFWIAMTVSIGAILTAVFSLIIKGG